MKMYSVRHLVEDFTACFRFYQKDLGMEPVWGDENGPYADLRAGSDVTLALFKKDLMAEAVGTKGLPKSALSQDKSLVSLQVDNLDETYDRLTKAGVGFVNEPKDYPGWTIRAVHLRDPDGNLVELFSPLSREQWTEEAQAKDDATSVS